MSSDEDSESTSWEIIDPGPHCICGGPDTGTFMICCDECEVWYHGKCINLSRRLAASIEKFKCHKCTGLSIKDSIDRALNSRSLSNSSHRLPPPPKSRPPVAVVKTSAYIEPKQYVKRKLRDEPIKVKSTSSKKVKYKEYNEEKTEKKRKVVSEQIYSSLNKGNISDKDKHNDPYYYTIPSEEYLKQLSIDIENALFDFYEEVGKEYLDQYKILRYNLQVSSNIKLRNQVINKIIKVDTLVRMTNEDMAPETVISFRKEKEELSLEARLKETEDERPQIILSEPVVQEEIPYVPVPSTVVEENEEDEEKSVDLKSSSSSITRTFESPKKIENLNHSSKIIIPETTKKNDFEIHVEDQKLDVDVDSYLIGWKGCISYKAVCDEFRAVAYHVTGPRFDQYLLNVDSFTQKERVDKSKILKYLSELESSSTRSRSIMRLEPESILDSELYASLFEHLNNLHRSGVVLLEGSLKDNVFKEIYVIPIKGDPDSLTELPSFIPRHLINEGKDRLFVALIADKKKVSGKNNNNTSEKSLSPVVPLPESIVRMDENKYNENKSINSSKVGLDSMPYGHSYQPMLPMSMVMPGYPQSSGYGSYRYSQIDPMYNQNMMKMPHEGINNIQIDSQSLEKLKKALNINPKSLR